VTAHPATTEGRQLALLWLAAVVSAIALRPLWLAAAPHLRSCVAGLLFVVGAPIAVIWTTTRWPVPSLSNPLPPWVRIAAVGLIAANWLYLIVRA